MTGSPNTFPIRTLLSAIALFVAATVPAPASAQYKWLTPDGRTVYSDLPPSTGDVAVSRLTSRGFASTEAPGLPYALKIVTERHPVTLYSAAECEPCAQARAHLQARGVPFSEKLVTTSADLDAFKALGFVEATLPALTVGRERSIGFETGAWNRLLTAAGYPEKSMLPSGYQQAKAEPLVPPPPQGVTVNAQQRAPAAETAERPRAIEQYRASLQAAERARQPDTQNPAALRF